MSAATALPSHLSVCQKNPGAETKPQVGLREVDDADGDVPVFMRQQAPETLEEANPKAVSARRHPVAGGARTGRGDKAQEPR